MMTPDIQEASLAVEIKSFSITRLKLQGLDTDETSDRLVEIKSFSITRLKQDQWIRRRRESNVEIKSFSITRLKRACKRPSRKHQKSCWNQKFLDYEIETRWVARTPNFPSFSWNQKFLDYEIETNL